MTFGLICTLDYKKLIFPAIFLIFIFAPSIGSNTVYNRLLFAGLALAAFEPYCKIKLELPQKLFLAWLSWAVICSMLCDHEAIAVQGFYLRCEGVITLVILTILAASYWSELKDLKILSILSAISMLIVTGFYVVHYWSYELEDNRWEIITKVATGAFAGVISPALYSINPFLVILTLPALYFTENRSGLIGAFIGILFLALLKWPKIARKWPLYASIVLLAIFAAFSPLKQKLAHLNTKTIGSGARPQWILQADRLDHALPLTGFGLDTLSFYLKPASGVCTDKNKIPDRVHCIVYDIILQTGWIGYALMLTCLAASIYYVWTYRTPNNIACFSVLVSWVTIGLINPQGIFAHEAALIALFGLRRNE